MKNYLTMKCLKQEARGFLVDLYEKGETSEDIAAAASVMRAHSIKLELSDNT